MADKAWVLDYLTNEELDMLEQRKPVALYAFGRPLIMYVFSGFAGDEFPEQEAVDLVTTEYNIRENHVYVSVSSLLRRSA